MRMESHRVVSVWIFPRVEQQPNKLEVTKLRCQGECTMPVLAVGAPKRPASLVKASHSRRHCQIYPGAAPNQGVHRLELGVTERG